jgi:hypothetical protein
MQAVCSSETSVNFYNITGSQISEDGNLQLRKSFFGLISTENTMAP